MDNIQIEEETSAPKKKIYLCPVDRIPPGQGLCFIIKDMEVGVFRPRSGGLYAIHNRCPHRNAPLNDGIIDDCHVICPFHSQTFDLRTGEGKGMKLKTYTVEENNGEIFLIL